MYWVNCSRTLESATILSLQIGEEIRLWYTILFTEKHKSGLADCWSLQNITLWETHTVIILVTWVGTIITFPLWDYWWIMKCLREPKENLKRLLCIDWHKHINTEIHWEWLSLGLHSNFKLHAFTRACHFWSREWGDMGMSMTSIQIIHVGAYTVQF